MARPKFIPSYVREDGTFCVVAKFDTTQSAANLRDQINEWCNQWVEEHKHWKRPVSESVIAADKGPWNYFEIFTGTPYVTKAEDNQLWIRLDGEYSYWWRDWGARIHDSLIKDFPELKSNYELSFDCDE